MFAETNIEFEIVDLDDEHHAARRYTRQLKVQRFPTTVLVRPDGEAIEIPFDGSFDDVGAVVFESVASSKLRQRITQSVLRRYCVVLLVECDDAKRNEAAARVVRTSFDAIDKVFDKMPKAVGALPELIAVPRAGQPAERILLWSLGIPQTGPRPVVTILTGRGRQFGPSSGTISLRRAAAGARTPW